MDQATATPASTPASGNRALQYDGRIGEIYAIFLLNLLFTILTLGIWRFWAITRTRRYFWSRMRFQGERFEYTGTGGELFVGFLLAGLVLIGMAIVAVAIAFGMSLIWQPLAAIPIIVFYALVLVLAAGAIFSAQRYRLTRTLWSGIRGGMTGSMLAYGVRSIAYTILAALTLFQLVPWVQVRLAERRINASSFGSSCFSFRGRAGQLYLAYLATLVGTLVLFAIVGGVAFAALQAFAPGALDLDAIDMDDQQTQATVIAGAAFIPIIALFVFGILSAFITCWYSALFERHVVGNTALGSRPGEHVRFASSMSGRGLLGLVLGNLCITVFTLGLGIPIVLHRNARFLSRTLWILGTLDTEGLKQSTLASPAYGEGMFQQLDATGWM